MTDSTMLKIMGELFYLIVALFAAHGIWNILGEYRAINSTAGKANIAAYELQKLIEARARRA